ncbi:MAG: pantoate--beta-alanine ligase [Rubinisphaera brasiliensis]|uniref:pantoate--beta-alanine ligase n=1 Tax=Rubinisphaera brasiliensis TaxID=119 RepID=UPI00391A5400
MQTTQTISGVREAIRLARQSGQTIGCVPTMGALHEGHLSLIRAAREQSDFVVATIFVNPTQFAPHEDFSKYPRPLERDLDLCKQSGADLVFHPEPEEMYGSHNDVTVHVGELSTRWEGASRPDHFDGVATVVTKLFNIVQPDKAFFGAKDYQQQCIIKAMCRDLNLPVEVVTCPTIRSAEGLALSSRNAYLTDEQREIALSLSQSLSLAEKLVSENELSLEQIRTRMRDTMEAHSGVDVDYATIADRETLIELNERQPRMVALVAARVGSTRLLDNRELMQPE